MTTYAFDVTEGWTRQELYEFTLRELIEIAVQDLGHLVPGNVTKADMVALLLGEIDEIPLAPEEMIRIATQYRAWVRGVPPGESCLSAADKFYLDNLYRSLDPIWYLTN